MKHYPSIPGINNAKHLIGRSCICWKKLDGSQIRTEWSPKQGWYKFGSRSQLLCDVNLDEAKTLFMRDYAEPLTKAITDCKDFHKPQSAIAFLEFFGPHSFAGKHDPGYLGVKSNDPKNVILFDVNIGKKGICGPRQFLNIFGHLPIPEVIYDGPLTEEFILAVRNGEYPVKEGVVCKGGEGHKLWMCKIKTFAYLEELKKRFGKDWERYE